LSGQARSGALGEIVRPSRGLLEPATSSAPAGDSMRKQGGGEA